MNIFFAILPHPSHLSSDPSQLCINYRREWSWSFVNHKCKDCRNICVGDWPEGPCMDLVILAPSTDHCIYNQITRAQVDIVKSKEFSLKNVFPTMTLRRFDSPLLAKYEQGLTAGLLHVTTITEQDGGWSHYSDTTQDQAVFIKG